MRIVLLLVLSLLPWWAAAQSVPAPKPATKAKVAPLPIKPRQLGLCTACHGENGRSRVAGTPHLNGQDRLYLANSLRAYRNGSRKAQPMNSIANSLQPKDIEQLAAWYAAQPAGVKP